MSEFIPYEDMSATFRGQLAKGNTPGELLARAEDGFHELSELRLAVAQWAEFINEKVCEQATELGRLHGGKMPEHDPERYDQGDFYIDLGVAPEQDDGAFLDAYLEGAKRHEGVVSDDDG